jgi:hypothetical protein
MRSICSALLLSLLVAVSAGGCGPSSESIAVNAEASWNWAEGEAAGDVNAWEGELPLLGPVSSDVSTDLVAAADVADAGPVQQMTSIDWLENDSQANPHAPTWKHYTFAGESCPLCVLAERLFADAELIRQSRAWNCERILLDEMPKSGLPVDEFIAPAAMKPCPRPQIVPGCPRDAAAYAARLYRSWYLAMGRTMPPAK